MASAAETARRNAITQRRLDREASLPRSLPGVGPTGETHCQLGKVYRFVVRGGPISHGGDAARLDVGSFYRKCLGCGQMFTDAPIG